MRRHNNLVDIGISVVSLALLASWIFLASVVIHDHWLREHNAATLIAPCPPPMATTYEEHPIGGYLLTTPDTTVVDSLRTIRLPAGALLEIPHQVRMGNGDVIPPGPVRL